MWIYILIGILLIYALYKEMQALGCDDILKGQDCDNINGKAVKGTVSYPTDSTSTIFDKIEFAAGYKKRFVTWRSYLLLSFLVSVFLWFIIFKKIPPPEWELLIMMIILFLALNAYSSFYNFHLSNYIENNIDRSIDILRSRYE